jgi:hypothetical protein
LTADKAKDGLPIFKAQSLQEAKKWVIFLFWWSKLTEQGPIGNLDKRAETMSLDHQRSSAQWCVPSSTQE